MATHRVKIHWKRFSARFVLPTALTFSLFITVFFMVVIPVIERNIMDRKREMIQELTNSAWNILAKLENDERAGLLTRDQAQAQAIDQIRNLHYGQEMKDYFWINDMHPRMVIHPYRTDLNGEDLTEYTDPDGKKVFVAFVEMVRSQGAGFVTYMWQWKDDSHRILPKISYVKGFAPWEWIIGTGIYIDDVKAEIDRITRSMITLSLGILLLIASLLAFIIRQSFMTLQSQQIAEYALRESEEKYRTLVESAGDGILMALQGVFMHANQTLAALLEYEPADFIRLNALDIFSPSAIEEHRSFLNNLMSGQIEPEVVEIQLLTRTNAIKEVIFSTSPIEIGGKKGFIAVVTDITKRKQVEEALGESEAKFRTMANNVNVGMLRMTLGDAPRFVEINPAMVALLGFASKEELLSTPFAALFASPEDRKAASAIMSTGVTTETIVPLRKKDGELITASIQGVVVRDEEGTPQFFDGIIHDVSDQKRKDEERDKQLMEMQTALSFLHKPLHELTLRPALECSRDSSIRDVLTQMDSMATGIALISEGTEPPQKMILRDDLNRSILESNTPLDSKLPDHLMVPIAATNAMTPVFETWHLLHEGRTTELIVVDEDRKVLGVVSAGDLGSLQSYSPIGMLLQIRAAKSQQDVVSANARLPQMIVSLVNGGARPESVTHLTTLIIDTILRKLIEFAIADLGSPPVKFAFIVFGSEGREEQTLRTDQDNAIIYEDVEPSHQSTVQGYFLELGKRVCGWLNDAGYEYCVGNNMAQNPQWCQPIGVWKRYFRDWIFQSSAEDLLRIKIFFDFRCAYGDRVFETQLREFIDEIAPDNPRFFQLLVRNVLPMTPPIGLFGQFVVESVTDRGKVFDIKSAMMPIVDYARIYAIRYKIKATNTPERLKELQKMGVLSLKNYQEMIQAYSYLMQIRLRIQAEALWISGRNPDNYISPSSLSYIERRLLKEIFTQTKHFMAKLSYDFTGQ